MIEAVRIRSLPRISGTRLALLATLTSGCASGDGAATTGFSSGGSAVTESASGDGDMSSSTTGDGDGDGTDSSTGDGDGDGDGDGSTGDGDGSTGDGDGSTGDGDGSTGDGDGSTGDGDGSTGDGDGSTGDGDGDGSTGDGDGDGSTGDGDGSTGDGDGDGSTGDGDGSTGDGDGDGSTGDGDGDGSTGDGDGDGSTGDGDGDGCTNVLVNPGAETGNLNGWTVVSNLGDGYVMAAGAGADMGAWFFTTSYGLFQRQQVVDLITLGYSAAFLDSAPPIDASDWFSEHFAADQWQVTVELLDANDLVIDTWNASGTTTGGGATTDDFWFEQAHTFTGYGAGLRKVRFTDGGQDGEFWAGQYGIRIDGSAVIICQ
jgi:hypothetical protein